MDDLNRRKDFGVILPSIIIPDLLDELEPIYRHRGITALLHNIFHENQQN